MSDFRAMDIDRFWELIEQARTNAGPAADQAVRDFDEPEDDPDRDYWDFDDMDLQSALSEADTGIESDDLDESLEDDDEDDEDVTDPMANALLEILAQLPAAEIAGFESRFEEVRAQADREDIANAATLIEHGFLADDTFDDFRAGLVGLGRATFEAALSDPDSLAGHAIVREIALANDPRWLGREDLLFVASHAYSAVTGEDELAFYDYVERLAEADADLAKAPDADDATVGSPDDWPGDWAVTDEAETRRRLPRLSELFYDRSMRNRERAMAKLGLQD